MTSLKANIHFLPSSSKHVTQNTSLLSSRAMELSRFRKASSSNSDIRKIAAEKLFFEYLHGYPGEPLWLTALLQGDTKYEEPDVHDMKQVRHNYQ